MRGFLILILVCVTGLARAELVIKDAVVRLLPPGVPNTSAYFSIENRSDTRQILVGANADFVNKAELHNHIMVDGMMRMQQQSEIVVEAGETVNFRPGGLHIMLFGLKQPLKQGQVVSMNLQTKDGQTVAINAKVARPSAHAHH